MNYGVTDALAPFPLHSLVSTMTATINNNTVSMNVQDTLPLLLRMVDPEELAKYNDMTPTALDHLAHYSDAVDAMDYQIDYQIIGAAGAGSVEIPGSLLRRRRRCCRNTGRCRGYSSQIVHVVSQQCIRLRHEQVHRTHGHAEVKRVVEAQSATRRRVLKIEL